MAESKAEGNMEENMNNYQQENIFNITPNNTLPCIKQESEENQFSGNIADKR